MAKFDTTFISKTPPFGDAQALPFVEVLTNADVDLLQVAINSYLQSLPQALASDTLIYCQSVDIKQTAPPMPIFVATLFMTALGTP